MPCRFRRGPREPECQNLVERLSRRWALMEGTRDAGIDVSIGSASSSAQRSTIEGMFAAADEAMHPVKLETLVPKQGIAIARDGVGKRWPVGIGFPAPRIGAFA